MEEKINHCGRTVQYPYHTTIILSYLNLKSCQYILKIGNYFEVNKLLNIESFIANWLKYQTWRKFRKIIATFRILNISFYSYICGWFQTRPACAGCNMTFDGCYCIPALNCTLTKPSNAASGLPQCALWPWPANMHFTNL